MSEVVCRFQDVRLQSGTGVTIGACRVHFGFYTILPL
jgi:hypothetical protein